VAGGGELTQLGQIRQQCGRQFPEVFGHAPQAESLRRGLTAPAERAELRSLAQDYLRTLEAFRCRESHVTDKMPTNFVHLGLVALLFPNATVIHCRRNPMDVMVSCFCQNLRPPFCDWERLVHYHRHYRRQMRYWQRALPLHLHTVDYETLVAEPQTEARRLVEHCGLPWDDRCLAFHRHHRAVHTPSKWQVRQPLYRSSVGKWRRFQPQLAAVAEQVFSELRAEGESHRGGPAGTGAAAGASDFHVHAFPA
jgi:hypothetical protein